MVLKKAVSVVYITFYSNTQAVGYEIKIKRWIFYFIKNN